MTATTKFIKTAYANIETPTSPNPRLAAELSSTATTITLTSGILVQAGTKPTDAVIFGIKNRDTGYTELCYVTSANISTDGKTLSSVVRGISRDGQAGVDLTTAVTANQSSHPQDSEVRVVVAPHIFEMMADALQGAIASGGASWSIGSDADEDIKVYAANGDANKPFWGYDASEDEWVYSNDGVSTTGFGTGAGVTGGDGITVTAGDIDIDLTDTTVFKNASAGAGDAGIAPVLDTAGRLDTSIIGATYTEVNQLSGTTNIGEANTFFGATDLTGAQAETLSDGSNADLLHVHTASGSYAAGVVADLVATGSAANNVSVTGLGFVPKMIKLHFWIQGHTGAAETQSYNCSTGIAVYVGTTLKFTRYIGTGTTNSDNAAPTVFSTSVNGTSAPVSGSDAGNKITLSMASIDADGFTIARTTVATQGDNARAAISWEAYA